MSLDVVLLDSVGSPERTASIGADAHRRMFEVLGQDFPLLHRMSAYYEDAAYSPDETERLRGEVLVAKAMVTESPDLCRFVCELLEILSIAAQRSCGVAVIAD